jgi:hypothetical protein
MNSSRAIPGFRLIKAMVLIMVFTLLVLNPGRAAGGAGSTLDYVFAGHGGPDAAEAPTSSAGSCLPNNTPPLSQSTS